MAGNEWSFSIRKLIYFHLRQHVDASRRKLKFGFRDWNLQKEAWSIDSSTSAFISARCDTFHFNFSAPEKKWKAWGWVEWIRIVNWNIFPPLHLWLTWLASSSSYKVKNEFFSSAGSADWLFSLSALSIFNFFLWTQLGRDRRWCW